MKTASGGTPTAQDDTNGVDGADAAGGAADEDGDWLIPTQPMSGSSADVKGKKRAREEDEAGDESEKTAVEYDAAAGTRYGEVVRYTTENLPDELEKCESRCISAGDVSPDAHAEVGTCRLGAAVSTFLAVRRGLRDGSRGLVFRNAREHRCTNCGKMCVPLLRRTRSTRAD